MKFMSSTCVWSIIGILCVLGIAECAQTSKKLTEATSSKADLPQNDVTPKNMENVPVDKLYVVQGKALLVNLSLACTPDDWLKVPGVKGAWRNFDSRGKVVLQDVDGDGDFEFYGTGYGTASSRATFSCREKDGTTRWTIPAVGCCEYNNGVWCEDIDDDGKYEVVDVECYLTVLDACTRERKIERFIYHDLFRCFW